MSARPAIPCGFGSGFKLGRNCDNSRNKEQLNFYLIRDNSSGTHWRKTAPTSSFAFKDPWHALIGGTVAFDPHLNLLNLCGYLFVEWFVALYFWSLGISLYLELFCFLSFITFVLRNLCSGTHRRNRKSRRNIAAAVKDKVSDRIGAVNWKQC